MATRVVAGRFRLIEPLGRGGMGTVWRAEDQVLGRIVALKEVSLPPSLDAPEREAMRERVLREARAAARLSHASAVTVFDVLEEDDYTFIAMEMVDSPTLAGIVEEHGPLDPARAAAIGLSLLDTLEAAHAKGIVHRDVKPANVMVSDEFVKLADFGIASVKGDPQLTATGLLLGSPSYMSPEQISGDPAGPASDLWAVGATLYFAVEGRGPFDREGPLPTLMAISNEEPPEPAHAGPLAPAIVSLLEKDPEARATAAQLRSMLEPIAISPAAGAEARHQDASSVQEAPAELPGEPDPDLSPRRPLAASSLAAVPDIETTWEQEEPQEVARTIPVAASERRRSEAAPAAPPRTGPPAGPALDPRKGWAVAAGALVLLLLAFLVLPRLFSSPTTEGDPPVPPDTNPAPEAAPAAPAPASENERESPAGAAGPEDRSGSGGAAVPSGWRSVALGDTGYGIDHPPSWEVRSNPLGDGSSMRFDGPQGKYLLVDWTDEPGADALAAWEQQAAGFAERHRNYREVRLEETEYQDFPTAAIWEWTYSSDGADLRAANLGFADEAYGFALNFQTRAGDWEDSQDEFEAFKTSFGAR